MRKLYTLIFVLLSASSFAQNPTISGDTMLCPNGTGILTTQQYDTYQWFIRYFGSGTIAPIAGATSQTLVIDYATYAASYISVEVTLGSNDYISPEVLVDGYAFAGCTVASSGEFTIGPMGESIICPGDTMFFEILMPYNTNITWYKNNDTIPGITSTILTVTEPGNYYVTGAPASCPAYIEGPGVTLEVIDCTVGIGENTLNSVSVFPNPAENVIHINNAKLNEDFTIVNVTGKIMMEGKIISDRMLLNIEAFPAGSYFFRSGTSTKMIVKK